MIKFTRLNPGDLIDLESVKSLFPWLANDTLYDWAKAYRENPDGGEYPPCAKIGRQLVWSRPHLVDFVNRKFAEFLHAS